MPKKKQKPRGISKLRLADPSIPDPLRPHQIKKGEVRNPLGQSKKVRLSQAIEDGLAEIDEDTKIIEAGIIAKRLLKRARNDTAEIRFVMEVTEPEKLMQQNQNSGIGLAVRTEDTTVLF